MNPVITPVSTKSIVDQVVDKLEMAIMKGELPGGARLSEQGLAASLGISRSPIREALRRLEGRRLIERTTNVGVRVASLSPEYLEEILVVRLTLEATAARLAAKLISAADLARLERLLKKLETKGHTPTEYHRSADHDFHICIIRASGNRKLIDYLCEDLYYLMRVYRYRSGLTRGRFEQALAEHRAILAALKSHDADAAETAMRAHLTSAHQNMLRLFKEPAIA